MENSVSLQKLALVRMWQAKFLTKNPKSDSPDKLPKAAELMLLAWRHLTVNHFIL